MSIRRKIKTAIIIAVALVALPVAAKIFARSQVRAIQKGKELEAASLIRSETTENTRSEVRDGLIEATVTYVVDGDTFYADIAGERTKIRLIGVDTPESVATEEYLQKSGKQNTAEGKSASDYTKQLLPAGTKVRLETDACETDDYGRLLYYVWISSDTMVQDLLLRDGYA